MPLFLCCVGERWKELEMVMGSRYLGLTFLCRVRKWNWKQSAVLLMDIGGDATYRSGVSWSGIKFFFSPRDDGWPTLFTVHFHDATFPCWDSVQSSRQSQFMILEIGTFG